MKRGLTGADERKLVGVNPRLVALVRLVAKTQPLMVIEGVRTITRQRQLLKERKTRTINSRHLTGHAVDIAPVNKRGDPSWDWSDYDPLVRHAKQMAELLNLQMVWGYDWEWDAPHWEMKR